jgi:hypothetical protein
VTAQSATGPRSRPDHRLNRAVVGRAAHHRCPDEEARLERLGRGSVAVEVAAVIGVHEDVGAALQFGIDAACRFELEGAGAGPGDGRAVDAVARQEVAGPPGLLGGLGFSAAWAIAWRLSSQPRRCWTAAGSGTRIEDSTECLSQRRGELLVSTDCQSLIFELSK